VALLRTLKYRPSFPDKPFSSLEEARTWVSTFTTWYNATHRHSAIRLVTPDPRHFGQESALLTLRHQLYQRARHRSAARGSRHTRSWTPVGAVRLNPSPNSNPTLLTLPPAA
jgi:putative transposase